MTKFRIVTYYDTAYAPAGHPVSQVNARYAESNGYDWRCAINYTAHCGTPYWTKLVLIEEELKSCDWLFWIDADALIVNHSIRLESLLVPDKDIILSSDSVGYCTGVFMMRNTPWCFDLLRTWLFCGEVKSKNPHCSERVASTEQGTFQTLVDCFPRVAEHCVAIPEEIVQNRESAYNAGAFICHYWGNSLGPDYAPIRRAVELYERDGYTAEVKRPTI